MVPSSAINLLLSSFLCHFQPHSSLSLQQKCHRGFKSEQYREGTNSLKQLVSPTNMCLTFVLKKINRRIDDDEWRKNWIRTNQSHSTDTIVASGHHAACLKPLFFLIFLRRMKRQETKQPWVITESRKDLSKN